MKRLLLVASLVGLTCTVHAAVTYFDDFQQFPSGTTLTETNYLPNLGVGSEIKTNEGNGEVATTVIASNLLSSTRAFFRLGTVPYSHQYRGDPTGGALTNQPIVLSYKLWVQQTKTTTSIGGIGINVTTTNIDFIDFSGTNYNNNPLIFINDGGQVFFFTNNPAPPAHLNNVQIGSWSALAGTAMDNTLTLDYPAGTFSFAINGTVLTNAAIPKFITNIFSRIRIDVFEGLSGAGTLTSTGNRFALDDVRLTSGVASTNLDVQNFIAGAKGQLFDQLTAGTPTAATDGFLFHADARGFESNSIVAASVQPPTGGSQSLTRNSPDDAQLELNDQFSTKSALDAAYHSSGTYTMSIDTQNQGPLAPALNLPADAYPTTPQISNFTAGQSINSATNFIARWSAFSGGTSTDFITFELDDNMGMSEFRTPNIFDPGALDGTATSATIPGGTLQPGSTHNGRLLFVKVVNRSTNSIPGAVGATGYFKQTLFTFATVAGAGVSCSLAPALATNDVNTTHTVTATILSNGTAVAGAMVDFSVINGPNTGNNGSDVTDAGGHASFMYSSSTNGVDVIQATSLQCTTTATNVWLGVNILPIASCHNVTNAAGALCRANVSGSQVGTGSMDPDGQIVSYSLDPLGPYQLGDTPVTLTVTDNRGGMDTCQATITVIDQTGPVITCPSNITVNVGAGVPDIIVNYPPATITDNCTVAFSSSVPASGSVFALGTNTVTVTAADASGNTNSCPFSIIVRAAQANLGITKTDAPDPVFVGSNLTYTVIVKNNGPDDATGVIMTDPLPPSVTFVSAIPNQGTCTQIAGTVTCDLGNLASNATTVITIHTVPNATGEPMNTATVTANEDDPNPLNNSASETTTILPVPHDLALVKLKAPKKITFKTGVTSVVGKFAVGIQNRGPQSEVIHNFGDLMNLVTVDVQSLSNCPSFAATMTLPKKTFPITLKSKQKLNLAFTATFDCANDGAATTALAAHNDYQTVAAVHHEALDNLADTFPADDNCPRNPGSTVPLGTGTTLDKGCVPAFTDVIVK